MNRRPLEDFEEAMILADIHRLGGTVTLTGLMNQVPGRYSRRYLKAALNRMAQRGLVRRGRAYGRFASTYTLPEGRKAA